MRTLNDVDHGDSNEFIPIPSISIPLPMTRSELSLLKSPNDPLSFYVDDWKYKVPKRDLI